jgi:antitoxin HicB
MRLSYAADLEPAEEGGFIVTFPDVPGAITNGDTREEAMAMAEEALALMLTEASKGGALPEPRGARAGQTVVTLGALASAKIALRLEMARAGISEQALAERLGVERREAHRILAVGQSTTFSRLEAAFLAVGRQISIQVEAA